jgi:hypothetical protein
MGPLDAGKRRHWTRKRGKKTKHKKKKEKKTKKSKQNKRKKEAKQTTAHFLVNIDLSLFTLVLLHELQLLRLDDLGLLNGELLLGKNEDLVGAFLGLPANEGGHVVQLLLNSGVVHVLYMKCKWGREHAKECLREGPEQNRTEEKKTKQKSSFLRPAQRKRAPKPSGALATECPSRNAPLPLSPTPQSLFFFFFSVVLCFFYSTKGA